MSESIAKDSDYVEAYPPDRAKLAEYLKQAKGNGRTMAEFAEVCKTKDGKPVSASTFSRIANGKITKPLPAELIESIIENAESAEGMDRDSFMRANGMVPKSEWEKNSFSARHEERRKSFEAIRHIIADELYSRGCMLRMCPGIPKDELPESRFYLPWRSRLAVVIQDFEPRLWNFIHMSFFDYSGDVFFDGKNLERNMRDAIDSSSYLFLRDMWEPETLRDVKNSFVFTEKEYYNAFCDMMMKIKVNNYMSVILIDTAGKRVVEEKMVPRYDQKVPVCIFDQLKISGF